jgi:hypothetical protein
VYSKCRKIYDLNICCPNALKKTIDGHHIENIFGYFSGICKECKK